MSPRKNPALLVVSACWPTSPAMEEATSRKLPPAIHRLKARRKEPRRASKAVRNPQNAGRARLRNRAHHSKCTFLHLLQDPIDRFLKELEVASLSYCPRPIHLSHARFAGKWSSIGRKKNLHDRIQPHQSRA